MRYRADCKLNLIVMESEEVEWPSPDDDDDDIQPQYEITFRSVL
jgi:hypothetical protein